jgi:hypothetical protein
MPPKNPLDSSTWRKLRPFLDEEISCLPEKYRAAIVLCCLAGKSAEQASRELGLSKATVASRLTRGRELLREQLSRRGVTVSARALNTALCKNASATPVPALLIIRTVKAAMCIAAGKAITAGLVSKRALELAEEAVGGPLVCRG